MAAFLVSRGCQRTHLRITQDQAVGIGQRQIDFRPQGHTIRFVFRGVPPRRFWAVSYWIRNGGGSGYRRVTVVLVDANTGKVTELFRER